MRQDGRFAAKSADPENLVVTPAKRPDLADGCVAFSNLWASIANSHFSHRQERMGYRPIERLAVAIEDRQVVAVAGSGSLAGESAGQQCRAGMSIEKVVCSIWHARLRVNSKSYRFPFFFHHLDDFLIVYWSFLHSRHNLSLHFKNRMNVYSCGLLRTNPRKQERQLFKKSIHNR